MTFSNETRRLRRELVVTPEAAQSVLRHAVQGAIGDLFDKVPRGADVLPQTLTVEVFGDPQGYRVRADLCVETRSDPVAVLNEALANQARRGVEEER